ncbi:two component transcriptional regulator, winged helix family [Rhizobium freirei PRF 81]|uniref:Two component transcriptional regulator, winged helix family n=1 Tax=Rhizobium freirei PRF 81 TaxID=363754 RepID=N6V932_9HYPH|nr:response regulator [Rhizobium freirei]ENN89701.1 two component transcriptional regulator, winged helix family [Rhizobium freirei PRF 81]
MENALVLIIEDEPEISDILERYFEREGFRVLTASDGEIGLSHHQRLRPDLVVLDVKLPKLDGYAVLAAIHKRGDTPVIMVTALADDVDRLQGLRAGADDYVVKPFNPAEVVARARAILRRSVAGGMGNKVLRIGKLSVDPVAHVASVDNGDQRVLLPLTRTEFRILEFMAGYQNRAFERGEIIDACLPEGEALDRTVDSHMSKLRRKLEAAGVGNLLNGVRGVGYRLGDLGQ